MPVFRRLLIVQALCSFLSFGFAVRALAQGASETGQVKTQGPSAADASRPHWSIDFRGGFGAASNLSGGSGQLPSSGAFLGAGSSPAAPETAASSWFFGNGATQINSIVGSTGLGKPIVPLDATLQSRIASRSPGAAAGIGLSRDLSPRASLGIDVDFALQPLGLTNAAGAAIESSRASFAPAWLPLLSASGAGVPTVTSAETGHASAGSQLQAIVSFTYRLTADRPLTPFIGVGLGTIVNRGGLPTATLTGTYSVPSLEHSHPADPPGVVTQADVAQLQADESGMSVVGTVTAGVEKHLSGRRGLRLEARLLIGTMKATTLLSATPATIAGSPLNSITIAGPTTTIVLPGTLSGSVNNVETFVARGTRLQTLITVGYFVRF